MDLCYGSMFCNTLAHAVPVCVVHVRHALAGMCAGLGPHVCCQPAGLQVFCVVAFVFQMVCPKAAALDLCQPVCCNKGSKNCCLPHAQIAGLNFVVALLPRLSTWPSVTVNTSIGLVSSCVAAFLCLSSRSKPLLHGQGHNSVLIVKQCLRPTGTQPLWWMRLTSAASTQTSFWGC